MMTKNPIITTFPVLFVFLLLLFATHVHASEYRIDPEHSFVEFRIQHLGFSWLYGRFNKLSGEFSHDVQNPQADQVSVQIETTSVDTNHAERDKHLRDERFLDVAKYPTATFKSTKFTGNAQRGVLEGYLTLHGVRKLIDIEIKKLGEGADPWGGYRAGFIGNTSLKLKDFGINYNLGPASETIELELGVEGIRE